MRAARTRQFHAAALQPRRGSRVYTLAEFHEGGGRSAARRVISVTRIRGELMRNASGSGSNGEDPVDVAEGSQMQSGDANGHQARKVPARDLLRMTPLPVRLSADELPLPGVTRWVRRRKLAVVAAILDRRLSVEEACERYDLSAEELVSWRDMVDLYGPAGISASTMLDPRRRRPD